MRKTLKYEHIESGESMTVEIDVSEEQGHWAARILGENAKQDLRAPVFYGTSPDQAERQLRKVFEKDYELIAENVAGR